MRVKRGSMNVVVEGIDVLNEKRAAYGLPCREILPFSGIIFFYPQRAQRSQSEKCL